MLQTLYVNIRNLPAMGWGLYNQCGLAYYLIILKDVKGFSKLSHFINDQTNTVGVLVLSIFYFIAINNFYLANFHFIDCY